MTDDAERCRIAVIDQDPVRKALSILIWIGAVAACLLLTLYVFSKARMSGEDSWAPMLHALKFLGAPARGRLYQTLFFSQHIKFQYPPSALLPLDLLRHLGVASFEQYNLVNAVALVFTGLIFAMFTTQILGPVFFLGLRCPIGPVAFIIAIRFYPNNLAFQIGQMQVILGLLFLLACWALLHDRRILAGCLIGAAGMVKPQFLPLGLIALRWKDLQFFGGLFTVVILGLALAVGRYGWDPQLDYLNVLTFLSKHGEYQHLNQSLGGILTRWLYHGHSLDRDPLGDIPQSEFPPYISGAYYPSVISSLVMLAVPFLLRAKSEDPVSRLQAFCAATILCTMASPIAWVHHFNVLLPAYTVAFKGIFERWTGGRALGVVVLTALSLCLVGYPLVAAAAATDPAHNILQSHVFFGACILVVVLLTEMRTTPRLIDAGASCPSGGLESA